MDNGEKGRQKTASDDKKNNRYKQTFKLTF